MWETNTCLVNTSKSKNTTTTKQQSNKSISARPIRKTYNAGAWATSLLSKILSQVGIVNDS